MKQKFNQQPQGSFVSPSGAGWGSCFAAALLTCSSSGFYLSLAPCPYRPGRVHSFPSVYDQHQ